MRVILLVTTKRSAAGYSPIPSICKQTVRMWRAKPHFAAFSSHSSEGLGRGIRSPGVSKHQLTELATGERVISERVPGVRSVALGFWIGAGSRDEPEARAGVSHFIEHLLFKGSSRYSAQEIAEIFDELGGELNAATSRETTVVYARIPDDRLERALDVMADMVFRPTFVDVDSEREVVLEEIAMVEDTPNDLVHDIAAEAVFGSHPLGRPVIGRAEVISTVSRRALAGYHRRAYQGEKIVLAAAGNVRHAELVALLAQRAERRCAGAGSRRAQARTRERRPSVRFQRKDTEQYHVCLSAPGISRSTTGGSPRRSWTRSSAARRRPGSSRRSARSAGWRTRSTATRRSTPTRGRSASTSGTREDNLAECLEIAVAELTDIAGGNVRADELARAKENLKGRILLSLESTSARMTRLGKSTVTDTPLLTPEQIVKRLEAVTAPRSPSSPMRSSRRSASRSRESAPTRPLRRRGRARESRAARESRLMRVALYGASGKVGVAARAGSACAGHESSTRGGPGRMVAMSRSTSRDPTPSPRTSRPASPKACPS